MINEFINKVNFNLKDAQKYILSTIVILAVFIMKDYVSSFLLASFLFSIAVVSIIWKRFTKLSLGLELNSFLTIILSLAYNPVIGIMFGVFSMAMSKSFDSAIS